MKVVWLYISLWFYYFVNTFFTGEGLFYLGLSTIY